MTTQIYLAPPESKSWLNGYYLEKILREQAFYADDSCKDICFVVPELKGMPLDAIILLLVVCNQLSDKGFQVQIAFSSKECPILSYCALMSFFEHLESNIVVTPSPDSLDEDKTEHSNLFKIVALTGEQNCSELSETLTCKIINAIDGHSDITLSEKQLNTLKHRYRTIILEMINNVKEHSKTELDGYVAMQVYGGYNPRATLIICDSGLGLFNTLKNSTEPENHQYKTDNFSEIIRKIFDEGVTSKKHDDGGSGLQTSFKYAKNMNSDIVLRTDKNQFRLHKLAEQEHPVDALKINEDFMQIDGTFFCFDIPLLKQDC
ncbi:hypothetical protein [Photobacterium chitinilyticum]|uniref:Uncharacterized protein n=1 Tax=Photobacterium chitinilyticum TaxID=2485123 RepID=A0A3S3QLM5_9GAMM|nr:hypothetical protein [Photobacterium chitinilyticum]RWX52890.1 hypothetical protein EDI28_24830 [Photobacterium chitinilyticum]